MRPHALLIDALPEILLPDTLLLGAEPLISDRTMAIVLAVGFVSLFITLAVLVWTRWGQARPVAKCVGLSLLAHLLLLIYAYSTHVLFDTPGRWYGQTVHVRIVDAADYEEASPLPPTTTPEEWNQPGEYEAELNAGPEAEASPTVEAEAEKEHPPIHAPQLLVTKPAPPADEPREMPQPPETHPQPTEPVAESIPPQENRADIAATAPVDAAEISEQPEPAIVREAADPLAADPGPAPTINITDRGTRTDATQPMFAATTAGIPRRLGDGKELPESLRARKAADRLKVAQPFGATPESEAAVAAALAWLARVQCSDGRWDAADHGAGRETRTLGHDRGGAGGRADTGITGLALLAFLGAGETHLEGEHCLAVQHGLEYLLASQAADGNLAGDAELFARMYCHGIATLALSEAYALTGDQRLLPGLKRALAYTIEAQHVGGGWRYQPYDQGDLSQFGWQLMALRSAEIAGLPIPPETRGRSQRFLRSVSSGRSYGLASYRPGDRTSRTMTAEALVCRYFLEAENSPAALDEAARNIMGELPGTGPANLYYWYYATLAMFQRQGGDWERWNAALQQELLNSQRFDGDAVGSWDPNCVWGGYGGRIYSTAMATLSLEVYYRYLPIYGAAANDRLTDRPQWPGISR